MFKQEFTFMFVLQRFLLLMVFVFTAGCSSIYYSAMDSVGIQLRDIMVHRVEKARDSQEEAKEQFKSALEQFTAVTNFKGSDLQDIYNKLNDEYEDSVSQAEDVRKHIDEIEDVSEALFEEWQDEIEEYSSASLKRNSQQQLRKTKNHYQQLITAMNKAESKIHPILAVFKDQVLYLKHNLNAQAISALKGELTTIESNVSVLIEAMERSINEADQFIQTMEN
jgi:Skp family chaperone for outer membrane proteins